MYSDEKSIIPFPSTLAVFFSIIVSIFVCILPFIRMHVHRHPLSQSSRYTTVERVLQCEAACALQTWCSEAENDEGHISACLFCNQVVFYSSFLVNIILVIKNHQEELR